MIPEPGSIGGWIEDPPGQDWGFEDGLLPKLVAADGDADLEPWCTAVSDQLSLSSCVANATADSYELCAGLEMAQAEAARRGIRDAVESGLSLAEIGREPEQISRLQIYFNGRSRMAGDGSRSRVGQDKGMYVRAAFDAVRVLGVCPERMWPYEAAKVNWRPPVQATWYALRHRIQAYYRIPDDPGSSLARLRQAVRGRHPVVFAVPVTEAFRTGSSFPIPPPRSGDEIYGHHAIVAVGTVGDHVKIRNSWGSDWGTRGYGFLHQDWFLNGHARSLFVPTKGVFFT